MGNTGSLNENIIRVKDSQEELKDQASEIDKDVRALSRSLEENVRSLETLAKTVEHISEDHVKGFGRLENKIVDLERTLALTKRELQQTQDESKSMTSDMVLLRDSVEHRDGSEMGIE